jgi:hypothetical protein
LLDEKVNVCGYKVLDSFGFAVAVAVVVAGKFHDFVLPPSSGCFVLHLSASGQNRRRRGTGQERRPEEGGRTLAAAQ